jgi:hypothetical protein
LAIRISLQLWNTVGPPSLGAPSLPASVAASVDASVPASDGGATHAPLVHTLPDAHALPHRPQLFGSVETLVSHPFADTPSQSAKPDEHTTPHRPAAHTALAFGSVAQTTPHPPQFDGSYIRFAQYVGAPAGHGVKNAPPQSIAHMPLEQICPVGHVRPHAPQFALSVCVLTQCALAPLPHSVCIAAHGVDAQCPATHDCPAMHMTPQPPQFALSVCVFAQY